MPYVYTCFHCAGKCTVPDELVGVAVECPRCLAEFFAYSPNDKDKQRHRCLDCGQTVGKLNPHVMCSAKVYVLRHIMTLNDAGYPLIRPDEGGEGFLYTEAERHPTVDDCRVHTQRLNYFGLVSHTPGRRTGGYGISQLGRDFLASRVTVPAKIWCRQGYVVLETVEQVNVRQVRHVQLDAAYWDSYYAEQAAGVRR